MVVALSRKTFFNFQTNDQITSAAKTMNRYIFWEATVNTNSVLAIHMIGN